MVSYNTSFIKPTHLLRTSSYINFFRIQCNFILYKYTHTFCFHFFLHFYLISFFCILIYYYYYYYSFFFFRVSGMFRDVRECSMFLVLSKAFSRGEIQASSRVTVFHGFLLLYEYFKNLTLYPLLTYLGLQTDKV